jgi:hypothetical protein
MPMLNTFTTAFGFTSSIQIDRAQIGRVVKDLQYINLAERACCITVHIDDKSELELPIIVFKIY